MTQWNDKSWQKDFLNMKSHSPSDARLLMGSLKGLKDAWRLGVLHVEYCLLYTSDAADED